jgi:hypothetical protein
MTSIMRILLTGFVLLASVAADADIIVDGTMTVSGNYVATGIIGDDLTTVGSITLSTVQAAGAGTLDFASTINFFTPDGTGGVTAALDGSLLPVYNFFSIGGWQLDLNSLTVAADTTADFLHLTGAGVISGNGYTGTAATWSFSAGNATLYSMNITAVPVPAAAWLFGSGLIGLVAVARRKA